MLAGVSVDYYARMEQGRERNPSAAVLNALGRALRLDADQRAHAFRLAGLAPEEAHAPVEAADPALLDLMAEWDSTPALVVDRCLGVLGRNALAQALYAGFTTSDNLVRMVFLDPHGRRFFADWERAAASCVAQLRLALPHPDAAAGLRLLVAEASENDDFRRLWADNDARGKLPESKSFHHPEVGALRLDVHAFDVRGASGQQLIVYRAPAGSPSAERLALLGSLHARARREARR